MAAPRVVASDGRIDYPQMLFQFINQINDAMASNNYPTVVNCVRHLDNLLVSKHDKKYNEAIDKLNKERTNEIRKCRNYVDDEKKTMVNFLWSNNIFRELMKLIDRKKLLPMEEIELEG